MSASYWHGIYTGITGQCVEWARRYLLSHTGLVFQDVPNAKDIFDLHSIYNIKTNHHDLWPSHENSMCHPPTKGALIIWAPKGYYAKTGHVAVVSRITKNHVEITEQNEKNKRVTTRLLPIRDGKIRCTHRDTQILGWKMLC